MNTYNLLLPTLIVAMLETTMLKLWHMSVFFLSRIWVEKLLLLDDWKVTRGCLLFMTKELSPTNTASTTVWTYVNSSCWSVYITWLELNCMININIVQGGSQDCMKGVARIWYLILSVLRNLSCWSSACELETWCYIYSNQWSIIPVISLFEHDKRLFTTHATQYSAHFSICSLFKNWS